MTPESRVSGVILAAGRSSRLGRPKQLLQLGGEPLLRHVVRNAVASHLSEVVLVLGHDASVIATAIGEQGQRLELNPDYESGQSSSMRLGLGTIDPNAAGVLFLLGDQPDIRPEVIDAIIERFQESGAPIVMPTYGGIPANPVLFASQMFPKLADVSGDEGARSVVRRYRNAVEYVAVSDDPPPRDVDTEDDYQQLLAHWSSSSEQ